MMKKNQLSIRLYGEPVGILEQENSGKKVFNYGSASAIPISIGMPVREEPYGEEHCEAFFGGLLPESETARRIIGKKYGVSPNNSFGLLKAIGYDCAGAISCHSTDEAVVSQRSVSLEGTKISDDELYVHIKALHTRPLFIDVEGLRLSLAGVQDKAAVCLIDNHIAFPKDGCPTTHILKPTSPYYSGLAENEYFCLKIAKRIGLSVSNVELRKIKDIVFLLVERYDRHITDGKIQRIHQEDFCQALSIITSNKYENEGGPGVNACFDLLKQTTQAAVDRNKLAEAIVFNYLIGNMDAHAKNFSLLHHAPSHIRLAPLYDTVSTRVYDNLTSKMAMKIGSKYDADHVLARHWEQLCETSGYRYISMINLIKHLCQEMKKAIVIEKNELKDKGLYNPVIDKVIKVIEININKLEKTT
ncbi:MAG TPA: type II toxin-antitoxin system HipA family toxin [Gammaproteobacteria bacterium]|nr:type II toxin-antitoxin system HipA family toxin [Gammaproteobacteria bacterium]